MNSCYARGPLGSLAECVYLVGGSPTARLTLPLAPAHCPSSCLPQIYSVESHRLALALDRRGMLVQIVRSAVLQAMGLLNRDGLRLANLF